MKEKIEQQVAHVLDSQAGGKIHHVLQSKLGLWGVAAISFFESSLPVPLITDPFMVAGILANRSRAGLVVLITIVSSILGGLAAFAMATLFFDVITQYMTASMQQDFEAIVAFEASDTLVTTFTGAITPIPYTITAWVVAVAGGSVWLFIVASIVGRSIRYAVVGYCAYMFGPAAIRYARRSLALTSLVVLGLVILYIWLKL